MDFGSISGVLAPVMGLMGSLMFWFLACGATVIVGFIGLIFRKRRKMNMAVIEMYDISNGVFDFKLTKGGWFKHKMTFFGLWDYGNERRFRLADGTPIDDLSHNDYRRINGQNGIVVIRNPHDSKFAIPISKFILDKESMRLMAQIAPADLRDVAVKSISDVDTEMQNKWQQYAPLIAAGFIGLILIFSILLIAQYGKHNVDVTSDTMRLAIEALRDMGNTGAVEKYSAAIAAP
jgi:hypothetical protein